MIDSGLLCPKCNGKTKVYETRNKPNGTTKRYRKCLYCDYHFRTIESVEENQTPQKRANSNRVIKEEVIELRNQGKTFREIGEILGVSKQRVYQVCGRLRKGNANIEKIHFKGIYEFMKENPKISYATLGRVFYGENITEKELHEFHKKLPNHNDITCTIGGIKRLIEYTGKTFEELFELRSNIE